MALANFFNKTSLAASQILQGYEQAGFAARLQGVTLEVAFDGAAASSPEGRLTLDMLVRLVARFYPNIKITAKDATAEAQKEPLESLAQSINPDISFGEEEIFASIVLGNSTHSSNGIVLYVGSTEWLVKFSRQHPIGSGSSTNPFGAGAVACIAVANVFRSLFKDQLFQADLDEDFTLSLLDYQLTHSTDGLKMENLSIDFSETFLVGLGAIGNSALWALSQLPNTSKGSVHIIEPEVLELSNLQRYVLATQHDLGQDKIVLCKYNHSILIQPFKGDWSSFLSNRKDWNLPVVALAVDSAQDRIAVQSSLPKVIFNSWTQASDLGISRHFDFLTGPCVACLYPPKKGVSTKSQQMAEYLGLPEHEVQIRELLYNNSLLDAEFIRKIANRKSISFELLQPFIGQPISVFYSKVICGGLITVDQHQQLETPMAFQSALAGILLASELVLHASGILRDNMETMTRINLLRPLTPFLLEAQVKAPYSNCICNDEDFKSIYQKKYSIP